MDEIKLEKLWKRHKDYPIMMDRLGGIIYGYLKGNIDGAFFRNIYVDEAVPFYKRVQLGEMHEEYASNYAPELILFRRVSALCVQAPETGMSEEEFQREVEQAVEEYLSKELHRKMRFIM